MKILRAVFISVFLFEAIPALALVPPGCSAWTEQESVVCIFAGETANLYRRQCENPCLLGYPGQACDQEQVCHFDNPDDFRTVCSEWVQESNMTCYNPNSNSFEQRWVRACTVGLRESWCSDVDPNLRR